MIPLVAASLAALGVHLLWTALAFGWGGVGLGPTRPGRPRRPHRARGWLAEAGLDDVAPGEFVAASATVALIGALATFGVFGSIPPALFAAGIAGATPALGYRSRRRGRLERAQEAWPRMIEEIRILTGSVGRSIPQALFEAAGRAPAELRGPFEAAHREWLITTDFARTVGVLEARLADPTADAACETLLVAHEVGGSDLDGRLEALAEDRQEDLQGRRDARAKQAGVRFARRFVLIVPFGMAVAGMSVGNGRAAYSSPGGQAAVVVGLVMVALCWAWSGRILRLPTEERVLHR